MQKDKYYTPDIEEFHIGFEFEALIEEHHAFNEGTKQWYKIKFGDLDTPQEKLLLGEFIHKNIINFNTENTRVKYLDEEDIESLGFVLITKDFPYSNVYEKNSYDLQYVKFLNSENPSLAKRIHMKGDHRQLHISIGEFNNWIGNTRFIGSVKNKSELKALLKQLGI